MIEIYNDEKQMEAAIYNNYEYKSKYFSTNNTNSSSDNQSITSMKDIAGWV